MANTFFMAEQTSRSRPYIIYRTSPGAGFCSNFAGVLQGLDHANQHGLVPVVDMERHKGLPEVCAADMDSKNIRAHSRRDQTVKQ